MKARMALAMLVSVGGMTAADGGPPQPTTTPARISPTSHGAANSSVRPPQALSIDEAAARVGVTADELRQLRKLGFSDPEAAALLRNGQRTAQELIAERAVLEDVGKAVAETSARVYKMLPVQAANERDQAMKAALARVRREHRLGRDELREILAGTSYFTADELKRHLGGSGFFGLDDSTLHRVGWPDFQPRRVERAAADR